MYFIDELNVGRSKLPADEANHCLKVLRKKVGDKIEVFNGRGLKASAVITHIKYNICEIDIENIEKIQPSQKQSEIVLAPIKNPGRMDWAIEKLTELGINKITLIQTQHTERHNIKLDRLHKLALAAAKQSKQFFLPEIVMENGFKNWLFSEKNTLNAKTKIFYAECENQTSINLNNSVSFLENKKLTQINAMKIIIGPEGDFSKEEKVLMLNNNFIPLSFGDKILRSETAAIYAGVILNGWAN